VGAAAAVSQPDAAAPDVLPTLAGVAAAALALTALARAVQGAGPAVTWLLEGGTVTPAMTGGTYTVNGADVVCGNVQTSNATVYIISSVLMPSS
jgi:uncharacterized surface protein with fasciclin (FAS1) repeats